MGDGQSRERVRQRKAFKQVGAQYGYQSPSKVRERCPLGAQLSKGDMREVKRALTTSGVQQHSGVNPAVVWQGSPELGVGGGAAEVSGGGDALGRAMETSGAEGYVRVGTRVWHAIA